MTELLKAASAKVDITPAVGMELSGHFRSELRSNGIHSNLYAKALALDDGENKVVIIACDLLGITSSFVASTRRRITELTGLDGENVMISCTHTHSGPGSMALRIVGKGDEAYQDQLGKKIAGVAYLALQNTKDASIGLATGNEELAASRRVRWPDGSIRFEWLDPKIKPEGPIDEELDVLTVRDAGGKTMAIVINFACHPVTMGGRAFNMISSDFPGVATTLVEKVKGDGAISLFLNGAYADTHPRRDLVQGQEMKGDELTTALGTILGAAALELSEMTATSSQVPIRTLSKVIRAPIEKAPSQAEMRGRMQADRQRLEEIRGTGESDERWWLEIRLGWYEHLLELYEDGKRFEEYEDLEVQAIRIGDVYIVGLPGEVFSEIGLEIKSHARELGLSKVLVVALANGNPGYIPAEGDYGIAPVGKRGYELEGSYMLYGRPLVGQGTANMLIEAAVDLLRALIDIRER